MSEPHDAPHSDTAGFVANSATLPHSGEDTHACSHYCRHDHKKECCFELHGCLDRTGMVEGLGGEVVVVVVLVVIVRAWICYQC